ncbi:sulfite exporter TauE/SafE family protein [Bacillus rubiinfantis]|uniref:sulfite exporter TauE/SafE family protein n=1 Tax=Bacillus rubiinfantis TaxID=1499680 RepID=UPI00069339B7|nr:sulfite exporter TauE/SafE family protein [Bacillus rubiinfantis]
MFIKVLLGVLVLLFLNYFVIFIKDYIKANKEGTLEKESKSKFATFGILGTVFNFFDTLGIGSFATSTASFKLGKMMPDKKIPGTLNVGTTSSVFFEALIFISIVKVDYLTLVVLIGATMLGAYFGASIVSKLPEIKIQWSMGVALFIVAFLMFAGFINLFTMDGVDIGLRGIKLGIGFVWCFVVGVAACLGIGQYAPIMAMSFVLGLSPLTAYPLMTGATAFMQTISGAKYVKEGQYHRKASLAYAICGPIGVVIAAFLVKNMPIGLLQKVIFVVVIYTAVQMIRSGLKGRKKASVPGEDSIAETVPETVHVGQPH